MNSDEIQRFLSDKKKSKLDLIDLATARFAIPRANLMKLRTDEVRETVKAALLHEDSLRIISQEAKRSGIKRS